MTARASAGSAAAPVLEIGGTHVTAALVAPDWSVDRTTSSRLRGDATAEELLDDIARTADTLAVGEPLDWTIALPGPFDYARGIGRYEGVGKFESLRGVDVGAELRRRLTPKPSGMLFVNDAEAFGLGESRIGAARGHRRAVCVTLGTGVGSCFLADGRPVRHHAGIPEGGEAFRLEYRGAPLEETVSRRAIIRAYSSRTGFTGIDVVDIAQRARAGDRDAADVLTSAFTALGVALAPCLTAFEASVLVVGGAIARSWDLIAPGIRDGIVAEDPQRRGILITPVRHPAHAALVGAAAWRGSRVPS